MSDGKVIVDVLVTDEALGKAVKLVELLKEAKTLAGELASIEFSEEKTLTSEGYLTAKGPNVRRTI